MSHEEEMKESIEKRRKYLIEALRCRREGQRQAMRAALNCAHCEKLNQMFFIGPCPF